MAYSKISWIIVCDIKIWECYIDFILPWITGILHLTKLILTLSLNPITTYHASASRVTARTSAIIVVWISFSYWRSLYSCSEGNRLAARLLACAVCHESECSRAVLCVCMGACICVFTPRLQFPASTIVSASAFLLWKLGHLSTVAGCCWLDIS